MNTELLRKAADDLAPWLDGATPVCALILGSGWAEAAEGFRVERAMDYGRIPLLGATGVAGHPGRLLLASADANQALIFQGRRHWYEGVGWEAIAFPIYLARAAGVPVLLLTNAAGGIRDDLDAGDLMLVEDHINAMGANPLQGPHDPCWGPRFPDQSAVYDRELSESLRRAGAATGVELKRGVYLAASGPAYETPAEIRAFRAWGADAVGMSTVPEALLAHAAGMRVAAVACVANRAAGCGAARLSHEDVIAATRRAQPRMGRLLHEACRRLPPEPSLRHGLRPPEHA